MGTHYRILNCTRFEIWLVFLLFFAINNLLCITYYSNVRIMCCDYNLPFLLCSANTWNKLAINRLVVKIVFWLIYDDWRSFLNKSKIENE